MAGTRTNMGGNMGAAGGDTQEDNSPTYSKNISAPLAAKVPATPGRTVTSGFNRNETSLPMGTPTPARNSGSGAGSGPSGAMAMHNASTSPVL
jgi:hypothetical protein